MDRKTYGCLSIARRHPALFAKLTATVLACAAVVACGGGDGGTNRTAGASAATSLVAIGNSLTIVPGAPGWLPARGMAASDPAHDFVHIAAATLGLPIAAQRNFASLERPANDPINTIDTQTPMAQQIADQTAGITSASDVVLELGDNAWTSPSPEYAEFVANYESLLDVIDAKAPRALVCLSTWWMDATKDAMISDACTLRGGRYVFIGDIYPTRTDVIPAGEDPRIWGHPHDASMAIIGARVAAAFGSAA